MEKDNEILYRGVFRLRKNNREDETAYRFLQNLPSGVSKNDIIKKALLEYIRGQTFPEDKDRESGSIKELKEELSEMEARLIKAIRETRVEETPAPPPASAEEKTEEIPLNALSFIANLNGQA